MATHLIDDIIGEIIAYAPRLWLGVNKRWRDTAFAALMARFMRHDASIYNTLDFTIVMRIDMTRFIQFVNLHDESSIKNVKAVLFDIDNNPLLYRLFSHWREVDDRLYKEFVVRCIIDGAVDYAYVCRLVEEHQLHHHEIFDDIYAGIYNALFEQDGYMFHRESWLSDDADIVIKYALKHYPDMIYRYISRSRMFPVNYDVFCLERILSYNDTRALVSQIEYGIAMATVKREREHEAKRGPFCIIAPATT